MSESELYDNSNFWIFIAGIYLLVAFYYWIRGYRRGQFKLEVKSTINSVVGLASMVGGILTLVVGITLFANIVDILDKQEAKIASEGGTTYGWFYPLIRAWILFVVAAAAVWIVYRGNSLQLWKFTSEEKFIRQESKLKLNRKVNKYITSTKLQKIFRTYIKDEEVISNDSSNISSW